MGIIVCVLRTYRGQRQENLPSLVLWATRKQRLESLAVKILISCPVEYSQRSREAREISLRQLPVWAIPDRLSTILSRAGSRGYAWVSGGRVTSLDDAHSKAKRDRIRTTVCPGFSKPISKESLNASTIIRIRCGVSVNLAKSVMTPLHASLMNVQGLISSQIVRHCAVSPIAHEYRVRDRAIDPTHRFVACGRGSSSCVLV